MIHARELEERNDEPRPAPSGCACFPNGDAPGYCPGRDRCPLCVPDEETGSES